MLHDWAEVSLWIAGNIVAVDSVSPTVFCIGETGELVKWFDCSDYMREPSDIAISGKEYFVCDFKVRPFLSWLPNADDVRNICAGSLRCCLQ